MRVAKTDVIAGFVPVAGDYLALSESISSGI
jgi:hypothetical protein